ncbi:DENN domain-containing protein 11 [Trichonephila clavipes]|nr:DENN domain-containing protein 11 [Trichonephila clavipes]
MADSEIVNDRTPLLERKGSISSIDSCNKLAFRTLENDDMKIKAVIDTENSKYGISNVIDVTEDSDCMLPYEENGSNPESYDIVCIFTVAFDTRAGNIVEWYLPRDCNVDGIEFRAMASGSHRVQTDFIYFKRGQLYGLACFENMPVDNVSERGARMKSVGVLAVTYTSLHYHMNFLRKQVRQLLENPGSYTEMEAYYERHKGSFPTFNAFSDHCNIDTTKLWNNIMPLMKGMGSNPGEGLYVCKFIMPLRHGGTLNSSQAVSSLVRLVEGPDHPQGVLLQNRVEPSQNVLSTVWCSKLQLMTGVHLALCHNEICGS